MRKRIVQFVSHIRAKLQVHLQEKEKKPREMSNIDALNYFIKNFGEELAAQTAPARPKPQPGTDRAV